VPNSLLEIGGCARDTCWDGRACLGVTHSSQASAEHFQQCAEFLPLRNRGLGPLAVPVLPIPFARRAAATACAAVQSTAPFFRRWRPAGLPAFGPRSAPPGCLKLHGLLVLLSALHCRGAKLTARQQRTTLTEASPPFSDGTL